MSCDTWTTKTGEVIPIVDLKDNHLKNILKLLQRQLIKVAAAKYIENMFLAGQCTADDFEVVPEKQHWFMQSDAMKKMNYDRLATEARSRNISWEMSWMLVEEQTRFWEAYIFCELMRERKAAVKEEQISRDFDEICNRESPG